jgi:hypothetical protein
MSTNEQDSKGNEPTKTDGQEVEGHYWQHKPAEQPEVEAHYYNRGAGGGGTPRRLRRQAR